jgi:hypothetical protein
MKTIITVLLLSVVTAVFPAKNRDGEDPNFTLILEGRFLSESKVSYEVYKMKTDSSLELVSKHTGNHDYSVNIDIGENYVVKFISRHGVIKYLYIHAAESGYFQLDVDFLKDGSAELKYKKDKYTVVPLTRSTPQRITKN